MNEENIQNELKEIAKQLERIKKINAGIQFLLQIIVVILIFFALMCFIYFSGHFPPI